MSEPTVSGRPETGATKPGRGAGWVRRVGVRLTALAAAIDKIYRPFIRPLAAFVVFGVVVVALLQGFGRLGMWLLDGLEGSANTWLDGRATVTGLEGGWDGLNPVASARRIDLPAGWVEQVTVELDLVESLRRNRPVLERLLIENAELLVEHTEAGWRLAATPALDTDFDWATMVGDSDEIRFGGRIAVAGAAKSGLALELRGVNRDGAHAYDLSVGRPDCASACRLEVRWRARDAGWLDRPEERYLALSGESAVPGAFLEWLGLSSGLQLRAHGRWLRRGDEAGGEFAVELDQVDLPGGIQGSLAATLRGTLRDGSREGVIMDVAMGADGAGLGLSPVFFRNTGAATEFWTDALPLGELAEFLTVALGGAEAPHRWLAALQPKGNLLNVHAAFGPQGLGYAATFDALGLDSYKGVPWIRQAGGEILGFQSGARVTLNSESAGVQIADVFRDRWRFDNLQGNLLAWFGDGYVGMRVPYFRFNTQGNRFSGAFALARPLDRYGQRVAILLNADRLGVRQARTYIPYRLSEGLQNWLAEGPRDGLLSDLRAAYQGQVHTRSDDRARRLDIQARISAVEVRYHPDWPHLTDAEGFIDVAGSETYARVDFGRILGAEIRDSRVLVGDRGAFAQVDLQATVQVGDALDFVRASPLAEWLAFVTPEWDGSGDLEMNGELFIPINESIAQDVGCRLDVDLADVGLVLPEYRVAVEHLNGPVQYLYPHYLNAAPMPAQLFGRSASIAVQSDDDSIDFRFQGTATEADVYRLADMSDYGIITGAAPFDAVLGIAVDDGVSQMTVNSDLVGLAVDLPGEFAKAPDIASPTWLNLRFLEEYVDLHLRHGDLLGRLHVDEVPLRGAIGVRGPAPAIEPTADDVVVSGRVGEVDINEWMAGASAMESPVPWRLAGVAVDRVRVETQVFEGVQVQGGERDGTMMLAFTSRDLTGSAIGRGEEPLQLRIESVHLAESDGEGDPLDVGVIDRLPEADVTIESLTIGDEDFGSWSFTMRQRPAGVLVGDLHANLKDTEITAAEGVFWDASTNRSAGAVRLTMEDLAQVLPQWDYAPSLEAESAELEIDASWRGSPLNVEINGLRGDVSFRAKNGSFVDVSGGGALRLLSLLNFNTILKRMSFNFKDVVAKGTSFDTIKAKTRFDDGVLTFVEPAKVKGSGSDFKIGGSVNLVDGIMNDNELIVTLPVSDSLPWYAVYISLANPAAAVAVLAGQQVLKKQIKQMSSAKYEISGSWDDPQVKMVGIWNNNMQDFEELAADRLESEYAVEAATEGGR